MRLILVVFFAAILAAASEAGFRLGRKAESRTAEKTKAQLGAIEGGILGVLALLLGFTMSMADPIRSTQAACAGRGQCHRDFLLAHQPPSRSGEYRD
jgi:hypothetical protein